MRDPYDDLIGLLNAGNYESEEPWGFSQRDYNAISRANRRVMPTKPTPTSEKDIPYEDDYENFAQNKGRTKVAGGLSEMLRLLAVGGASGAAGAGIASGASPMLEALRKYRQGPGMQPVNMVDPAMRERILQESEGFDPALQARAQRNMESLEPQNIKKDPTEPMSTEEELSMVQDSMGTESENNSDESAQDAAAMLENDEHSEDAGGNWEDNADFIQRNYRWQGKPGSVPTALDQKFVKEFPTDGIIQDFIDRFPEYEDQASIARGEGGMEDAPIMGVDTVEPYRRRKTRIDER